MEKRDAGNKRNEERTKTDGEGEREREGEGEGKDRLEVKQWMAGEAEGKLRVTCVEILGKQGSLSRVSVVSDNKNRLTRHREREKENGEGVTGRTSIPRVYCYFLLLLCLILQRFLSFLVSLISPVG